MDKDFLEYLKRTGTFLAKPVFVTIPTPSEEAKRPAVNEAMLTFYIDEAKRTVALKVRGRDERFVIHCDEKDKFDPIVGIGLAMSKSAAEGVFAKEYAYMRALLRDKKGRLDEKKYSDWVIHKFFGFKNVNYTKFLNNEYPYRDYKIVIKPLKKAEEPTTEAK